MENINPTPNQTTTKWTVSIQFTRSRAFHNFMSLLNRGLILNTKRINYDLTLMIVEIETTTEPNMEKLKKWGKVIDLKFVD
jgi:hypothetical protein